MGQEVKPGKYMHYKGTEAQVIGVARHSETQEEFVVYWHIESETGLNKLWVRPLGMFLENVTVNGEVKPRFKLVEADAS